MIDSYHATQIEVTPICKRTRLVTTCLFGNKTNEQLFDGFLPRSAITNSQECKNILR